MLVLHGDQDRYRPGRCGKELADAVPGARFERIVDAGHVAHLEQPERVNALIAELLA